MADRIIARWVKTTDSGSPAELQDERGRVYATVWTNGTWHTWDARGIGGENDSERSVLLAKEQAVAALDRQHRDPRRDWHRWRHWLRVSVDLSPRAAGGRKP